MIIVIIIIIISEIIIIVIIIIIRLSYSIPFGREKIYKSSLRRAGG